LTSTNNPPSTNNPQSSNITGYDTDQAIKRICVVNRLQTVSLSDDEIIKSLSAIQNGLKNEFLHYYGYSAKLYYANKTTQEPNNMWNMFLLDTSDVAGALGYHDSTAQGIPQGKIFVKTAQQYGAKWSITLDHEIKEAMSDPWGMNAYFQDYGTQKRLVAFENCDPVEADKYGYTGSNGIMLSNFVTPYWLHPFNDTAELDSKIKYDVGGLLSSSFQTLPGCHQSFYYIQGGPNGQKGWIDKNYRSAKPEISDIKDLDFGEKYNLGDEIDIYSAAQKNTNWHIMFRTPDQDLIDRFQITKKEVIDAVISAFNPSEGSRRDIRFKMSKMGGADNLVPNSPKFEETATGTDILEIDDSFDQVLAGSK
jgi:hypothetical protein